jgi:hypothetical protein
MLNRYLPVLALLLGVVLSPAPATAATVTATLTADNYYAVYLGTRTGRDVRFIGRNELGPNGSPGSFNWSRAETWAFDPLASDYLYIAAWSDNSVAQGLIGQFTYAGGQFLTNLTDGWEVALGNLDLGDNSPAPTVGEFGGVVAAASWNSVQYFQNHGVSPWGTIAGISGSAKWIWGTPNLNQSGSGAGEYQIFRRPLADITPVPLPAPFALLGAGLALLPALRRRAQPA